ncbi:histidine kinase [Luteibacter aegosomaticola]|uniref:sensor histidine kinase n=1 Tax=Luteibacter aegosomaticola TaxID=2911538 RepID=UPI001FF9650C|nr:sensor histidine kinase [Luteibacter aegosomaticola]UPG88020.1 histidine kinase [Luteibacter aegosomaticola]
MAGLSRALLALLLLFVVVHPGWAAPGEVTPITRWQHTVFTAKDGAPAEIRAMAQDRDGFLWLGGVTGLYRFDGVSFDGSLSGKLPHREIMTMVGTPDGSLWIGDRRGYVTRIKDGAITSYDVEPARATVMYLTQLDDGSLWAVSTRGAYQFEDGRWQRLALGAPPNQRFIQGVRGKDGALWIIGRDAAWRVAPSTHVVTAATIDEAYDGRLGRLHSQWRDPESIMSDTHVDSEGALWVGTSVGLQRASWPVPGGKPVVENYGMRDGLGGAQAVSVFPDREGNMWVATTSSVDQFRLGTFRRVAMPGETVFPAIAVDGKGVLWEGRMDGTVASHGVTLKTWPVDLIHVTSAATALDGSILMGGQDGIVHLDGERAVSVPIHPEGRTGMLRYLGVAQARDGSIWGLSDSAFRYADGETRQFAAAAGLPDRPDYALSIARRTDHGLWIGYSGNKLAWLEDDGSDVHVLDARDGIAVGQVFALWPHAGGTWIAGQEGVQFVMPGRPVQTLRVRGDEPLRDATGIVEQGDGSLWVKTVRGLYRVAPDALVAWRKAPATRVAFERFDERDGLPGISDERPAPSIVPGAGSTLWIAGDTGLASVDTARLVRNRIAPVAVVSKINGEAPGASEVLPAGTRRLDIEYSAPVLGVPGRAQFMHRLDGVDTEWQDAGNVRHVTYTNLGPGEYRFFVKAANEDGVWSATAASQVIRITPYAWQTTWFHGLVVLAVLGLLYLAYLWRLRSLGILICARLLERERIARELHDTLLQSLQGVLLRVKVAADAVDDADARAKLENAMRATQDALVEGRRKIVGLRGARGDASTLPERLKAWVAHIDGADGVRVDVDVSGMARSLNPAADDDIEAIVFELVGNAVRHAEATTVSVQMHFGRRWFEVVVRDDGKGIDAPREAASRPSFGLVGMRERAEKLASRLRIRPLSPRGTQAVLRVPGPVAYWLPERTVARLRARPWFR